MEARQPPKMVGRERELATLTGYLDDAIAGKGRCVFISGEAGIGKTRLIQEVKTVAAAKGFRVLSASCFYESLTPYMPFLEALKSGGLASLVNDRTPRVEGVFLASPSGLLIREVVREETELDPNVFTSMASTVGDFVSRSLSGPDGQSKGGTLSRLGHGSKTVLVNRGVDATLVVVLTGREDEFLLDEMNAILEWVHESYGETLRDWDGEDESVHGVDRLLKPLVESGSYDGLRLGEEDPESRRSLRFENVSLGLTRRASDQPILLVLEDMQWVDPSSAALFHYVARSAGASRMVLVGTYRPEDLVPRSGEPHHLADSISKMESEELNDELKLARLSHKDTVELLRSRLDEVRLDQALEAEFFHRTGGNPLFMVELLGLLLDVGNREHETPGYRIRGGPSLGAIPVKTRDVILRRLDRLDDPERRMLEVAAVLGERFSTRLLATTMAWQDSAVLLALRTLERRHRLVQFEDDGCRFDHVMVKQVLYDELPRELRMRYHGLAADAMRDMLPENQLAPADLAFHYSRSTEPERAIPWLQEAAQTAVAEFSNDEAIQFHTMALELATDTETRVKILVALGDVHDLVGNFDRSAESHRRALVLADPGRRTAIRVKLAWALQFMGEKDESMKICLDILKVVEGDGSKDEADVLAIIGILLNTKGDCERAFGYLGRALEIGMNTGDGKGVATVLLNLGNVCNNLGDKERALMHYRKALRFYANVGDKRGVAAALNNIGMVEADRCENDAALEHYRKSLELCRRLGNLKGIGRALNNIGIVYFATGKFDMAIEHFEECLRMGERQGDCPGIIRVLNNIALVQMARCSYEEAYSNLQRALSLSEKIGDSVIAARTLCNLGTAYHRDGNLEEALRNFTRSLSLSERIGHKDTMAASCNGMAMVHLENRSFDKAASLCDRSLSLSGEIESPFRRAMAKQASAMLHRTRGDFVRASEDFEESIGIFRRISDSFQLADASQEYGLLLMKTGDDEKALIHLLEARDLFRKLTLDQRADQVEKLLTAQGGVFPRE